MLQAQERTRGCRCGCRCRCQCTGAGGCRWAQVGAGVGAARMLRGARLAQGRLVARQPRPARAPAARHVRRGTQQRAARRRHGRPLQRPPGEGAGEGLGLRLRLGLGLGLGLGLKSGPGCVAMPTAAPPQGGVWGARAAALAVARSPRAQSAACRERPAARACAATVGCGCAWRGQSPTPRRHARLARAPRHRAAPGRPARADSWRRPATLRLRRLRRLRRCRGQSARPAPHRRHGQGGRWAARPAPRLPRRRSAGRDQATPEEAAAAASRALTWRRSTQRATPPPPRSRRSWAWVSFHAFPLRGGTEGLRRIVSDTVRESEKLRHEHAFSGGNSQHADYKNLIIHPQLSSQLSTLLSRRYSGGRSNSHGSSEIYLQHRTQACVSPSVIHPRHLRKDHACPTVPALRERPLPYPGERRPSSALAPSCLR